MQAPRGCVCVYGIVGVQPLILDFPRCITARSGGVPGEGHNMGAVIAAPGRLCGAVRQWHVSPFNEQ